MPRGRSPLRARVLAYFDPTLVYAADSVTLVLRQPLIDLGPGTLTPNQQATAPVVISVPALGAGLSGLGPASVRTLLEGLSGAEYSDVRRTNLELASGFTREVTERAAASAATSADGAARSWIDWKGEAESAAADSSAAGFRYQTRGLIGGGDLVQGDAVRMGWAGDIAHTNLGFAAASSSGVADRWDVGFNASVTDGASIALATVSLGQDRDRLARSVNWPAFTENHASSSAATEFSLLGEIGYRVGGNGFELVPFASWQWLGAQFSGFQESMPGPAALFGQEREAAETLYSIGARWDQRLGSDADTGRLDATLALVHQTGSEAPLVVENFLIEPRARFSVSGPHAAATWARGSLDLARPVTRTLTVHARLYGEASQSLRLPRRPGRRRRGRHQQHW